MEKENSAELNEDSNNLNSSSKYKNISPSKYPCRQFRLYGVSKEEVASSVEELGIVKVKRSHRNMNNFFIKTRHTLT